MSILRATDSLLKPKPYIIYARRPRPLLAIDVLATPLLDQM